MRTHTDPGWAELLARQRGVVTRGQSLRRGLDDDIISGRLRSGRWNAMHRGVYATFSGEAGREAVLWAAVLRGGPAAVLSHQTAAELLGLADEPSAVIHLTVPGGRHPQAIRGVLVHRSGRARAAAHPVQLPPRTRVEDTAIDLTQSAAGLDDACGWLCRAAGRRLTTAARLRAALDSRPKVRWRADLRIMLAEIGSGAHSLLEHRYIRDVERPHRLPPATRLARTESGGNPDPPLQLGGRHRPSVRRGPAGRRAPPAARLSRHTAPLRPLLHRGRPSASMITTDSPRFLPGKRS